MRIFTLGYFPFTMGGTIWRPISIEAEPLSSHTQDGVTLCVFRNPISGKFHVAEELSGGMVGHGTSESGALASTLQDLADADKKIVKEQIQDAIKQSQEAKELVPEEFWRRLSQGGKK